MSKTIAYVDFIQDCGGGTYKLEGYLGGSIKSQHHTILEFCVEDKEPVLATFVAVKNIHDGIEYDRFIDGTTFVVKIRIDPTLTNRIKVRCDGQPVIVRTNKFTGLSRLTFCYCRKGSMFWVSRMGSLSVAPYDIVKHIIFESGMAICILFNWRIIDIYRRARAYAKIQEKLRYIFKSPIIIAEAMITVPAALATRLIYFYAMSRKSRPIWIISDRMTAAGDNGEAFYRYLCESARIEGLADYYFVISRKSPDYSRFETSNRVLNYGSFRYKLTMLLADVVISSHADEETTNPFGRQHNRYTDLINFRFVFLQHGVIRHDLSNWLNRYNRNISLFITSAKLEYNSIIQGSYGYSRDRVALTGLPRYDLLKNKPKNVILLAPTYRASLVASGTNRFGERIYDKNFKNSDYAKFYRNFMKDERLIKCMQEYNFTGELYLHPVLKSQTSDFVENGVFKVAQFPYDYRDAFEKGSLLISDHSSVMFDFAYLKKPVIYAHFDAEQFYEKHTYDKSTFFDDEKQGFGPVCLDYESLITQTIATIKNTPVMQPNYLHRVKDFFEYNDKKNSERVLDAILFQESNQGDL